MGASQIQNAELLGLPTGAACISGPQQEPGLYPKEQAGDCLTHRHSV